MKKNWGKTLTKAAIVGGGVIAVDYGMNMLAEKVGFIAENPLAVNAAAIILGAALPEMLPGKGSKEIAEGIGFGMIAYGARGLAAQYLPGSAPATSGAYGQQWQAVNGSQDYQAVAGDIDHNVVAGDML